MSNSRREYHDRRDSSSSSSRPSRGGPRDPYSGPSGSHSSSSHNSSSHNSSSHNSSSHNSHNSSSHNSHNSAARDAQPYHSSRRPREDDRNDDTLPQSSRGSSTRHHESNSLPSTTLSSTPTWDPVAEALADPNWTRIYITNLPPKVTVDELQAIFGGLGTVAREKQKRGYPDQWPYKIKIYTDDDGSTKGDATLTYEDPNAARSAPDFFNGHQLRGATIAVQLAGKPEPPQGGWMTTGRGGHRGGGRGGHRGGGRGGRGGGYRGGGGGRGADHQRRYRPY